MSDYALSTNLYTFAQVKLGFFGWPSTSGEGEAIRKLERGDMIVPKFAQQATWSAQDGSADAQRAYCEAIGVAYEDVLAEYNATVAGGQGTLPFMLRVAAQADDDERADGVPWAAVHVEIVELERPFSANEFLRLRAIPMDIAAQFKGAVARGRHLQELPDGTAARIQEAASDADRDSHLRRYSLVEAIDADEAHEKLVMSGRATQPGDRVFIASAGGLLGLHDVTARGDLVATATPISRSPIELEELFEQAIARTRGTDSFSPSRAMAAVGEIKALCDGPRDVIVIDDFGRFYDRYVLLARKITQALEISKRPLPEPRAQAATTTPDDDETTAEFDELAALHGLEVDAVRRQLPNYMKIPPGVLNEAVTSLRAGKHLLLSGPPGTGKSTIAEALCRAVVANQYELATGTADWTTFDTIGGYMPSPEGLEFSPGIVLRCLEQGRWLVIDELNRADIDKAFGPLFTLLAGSGEMQSARRTVLPYRREGKNVEIRWAQQRSGARGDWVLTPGWRMIGTLNVSDKASLFQLSFAFLRRFAVVDVPLPARSDYETFLTSALGSEIGEQPRRRIVDAALDLAFSRRQLGPAILQDIAQFVRIGIVETSTGEPTYGDPVDAFVTAVRLYAVPQYEGAEAAETAQMMRIVKEAWPERGEDDWRILRDALDAVALN